MLDPTVEGTCPGRVSPCSALMVEPVEAVSARPVIAVMWAGGYLLSLVGGDAEMRVVSVQANPALASVLPTASIGTHEVPSCPDFTAGGRNRADAHPRPRRKPIS